jgi:O-antigen/teichoic acid export membrane protein
VTEEVVAPRQGRLGLASAAFATLYADIALAVVNLAVIPFLIARLGTEPYGILGIVAVLAGQLTVLHGGVGAAATRLIAESIGRGGEELVQRLTGVWVVAVASSALIGVMFLLLAPLAWRDAFHVSAATLPIALAAVPAGAAVVALGPALAAVYGVLTAREYFLYAAGLRLFQGAGRVIGAAVVVALGGGVVAVFWTQGLIDLISVLLGWVKSREPHGAAVEPRARVSFDAVGTVLKVGLPFGLVSLLVGLLSDGEKLAITLARSLEDFTYYSVPFNAVVKYTIVSGAVARVLMPRVAALGARGDADSATLIERVDRILVTASVGVLVPIAAIIPEILHFWVGDAFVVRSTLATRILILGIAANTAAFPAHAVLYARGRPAHLNYLYAAELVLHVVVVYLLVSSFGIVGAAAAWAIRMVLDAIVQRLLAERTLGRRLRNDVEVWLSLGLVFALVAAASVLPLSGRIALGLATALGCLVQLARGADGKVLFDAVLPWRWRRGSA